MGLSWQHLLIVLVIALVIFGTKRLRNIGSDLGSAVRGFKKAVKDDDEPEDDEDKEQRRVRHHPPDADFDDNTTSSRTSESRTSDRSKKS